MHILRYCLISVILLAAGIAYGCNGGQRENGYTVATRGAAKLGAQSIADFRCGACHEIPGIRGADGVFGPPLDAFGRRTYIAGLLPNAPDNLVRWIVSPQSVKPKTTMPALGVSEQQARNIAAYLYTLR